MKAIIFDLDGVIAITEEIHKKAFEFAFSGYGIDISKYDWNRDFAGKGHLFIVDTVFGKSPINSLLIDRWVHYYQLLAHKVQPVPGVLEFIKKNNKIPMIIATGSAKKSAEIVLTGLNVDLPLVSMEDVEEPKPSPALFLLAAKRLGVSPSDCVVFEDSPYGIQAGKSAGMRVIALSTTHTLEKLSLEMPEYIVKDFRSFLTKIEYPSFEER